ncbi:DUF434 domain-containing protein [Psychroserpens sp. SPM9]|uniref:DUF434 domain-containing protein n=1 Tax=Psychroserpens sp. SPM9 TaxID=2975598 RepID=UPI0021A6619A|nr:DUF434 domain-containing protein [Psychroserpens sp. SPM9]MDG5491003.1 DUF434 domain-containing protein [Psychroserpens sp. SPM9]
MPNRRNRGKNSNDDQLFGSEAIQKKLKEAILDMHYLLSRGYAEKSSLQLVGNNYRLNVRQQQAVRGMSASQQQVSRRQSHEITFDHINTETIIIDGFNLLIILESALSGAYIFKGLDHCYRDLSGVHGTYKRVQQTETALLLVGKLLKNNKVIWVFDQPVSNSGKLKTMLREFAKHHNFNWDIILENNPDKHLAESNQIVVSSDAWILDRSERWLNLGAHIIEQHIDEVNSIYCND